MVEQYKAKHTVKSLIVTKLRIEEQRLADRINAELGDSNAALFYNVENPPSDERDIRNYPVVIITRVKYLLLINYSSLAKWGAIFSAGRVNLIIDEELNYIDIAKFSIYDLLEMRDALNKTNKSDVKKTYERLQPELDKILSYSGSHQAKIRHFDLSELKKAEVSEYILELQDKVRDIYFSRDHFSENSRMKNRNDLLEAIALMANILARDVVCLNDDIYVGRSPTNLFRLKKQYNFRRYRQH